MISWALVSREFYEIISSATIETHVIQHVSEYEGKVEFSFTSTLQKVIHNSDTAFIFSKLIPEDLVEIVGYKNYALKQQNLPNVKVYNVINHVTGEIIPVAYIRKSYFSIFWPVYAIFIIFLTCIILWKRKNHQALIKQMKLIAQYFDNETTLSKEEAHHIMQNMAPNRECYEVIGSAINRLMDEIDNEREEYAVNYTEIENLTRITQEFKTCIHEINNPLTAIENNISEAIREANSKSLPRLNKIRDTLSYAKTMLYFRYTKAIDDSAKKRHNIVWLNQLIEESISIAASSTMSGRDENKFQNLTVKTYIDYEDNDKPHDIWTDKLALSGILINIFKNSFKYSDCTYLGVNVSIIKNPSNKDQVTVSFTITDEGAGFPEATLNNETNFRDFDGEPTFGIGLKIVDDILADQFKTTLHKSNQTDCFGDVKGARLSFTIGALVAMPVLPQNLPPHELCLIYNNEPNSLDAICGMMRRYTNVINARLYNSQTFDTSLLTEEEQHFTFSPIGDSEPSSNASIFAIIFDSSAHSIDFVRSYGRDKPNSKIILICNQSDYAFVQDKGYLSPYYSDDVFDVETEDDIEPIDNIYAVQHPVLMVDLIRIAFDLEEMTTQSNSTQKKKILLLEDNEDSAKQIITKLNTLYQVEHVSTNRDAIQALKHSQIGEEYDIIVSDVHLEDDLNDKFLQFKKKSPRYHNTPMLIHSGEKPTSNEYLFVNKLAGVDAVIEKINEQCGIKNTARQIAESHLPSFQSCMTYLDILNSQEFFQNSGKVTKDLLFQLIQYAHSLCGADAQLVNVSQKYRTEFQNFNNKLKEINNVFSDDEQNGLDENAQNSLDATVFTLLDEIGVLIEELKAALTPHFRYIAKEHIKTIVHTLKGYYEKGDIEMYIDYIKLQKKQISSIFKFALDKEAYFDIYRQLENTSKLPYTANAEMLEFHFELERVYFSLR